MTTNDTRSPDEMMRETEKTRADIESNLEALEQRLSPDEMLHQVGQAVAPARDGAVRFARNFGDTIRENPIPAALVGIGIGWLLLSKRRDDPEMEYSSYRGDPSRTVHDPVADPGDSGGTRVREAREWARDRGEWARERGERVRERGERVRERVADSADMAYRRASDSAHRAGQQISERTAAAGNFVQRRPILTGVAVAGVGAVIAAAIFARTDRGRTMVSRAADAVKDGSQQMGEAVRDTAESVFAEGSRTASDTKERMDGAAAKAGERAGHASDNVRQQAADARDKARETAERVRSGPRQSEETASSSAPHTRSVSEQVNADNNDPLKPAAVKPVPVSPPPFEETESPVGAGGVVHHDADTIAGGVSPGSKPGSTTDSKGAAPGASKN